MLRRLSCLLLLPCLARQGALGPGSEALSQQEAMELLKEYRGGFTKGDPLRQRGLPLACSACKMAGKRFQSQVASKIKGRGSQIDERKALQYA